MGIYVTKFYPKWVLIKFNTATSVSILTPFRLTSLKLDNSPKLPKVVLED